MNNDVKIFAMYLPQFHSIPENDAFWGKGFTDWKSVQQAKPLYKGHEQPKIPENDNYYDLSLKENVAWQAKIAKEYGIDAFGIYHYWFNNEKNLLTKPAQIILDNKDIDIDFFFAWDNTSWKRSWSNIEGGNDWAPLIDSKSKNSGPKILIEYILGSEKDWLNHYNYLKPFFKDSRYKKKDNRPIFVIYHYSDEIAKMCNYWDSLARDDGFDGLFFIFRYDESKNIPLDQNVFKYEPNFSGWRKLSFFEKASNKLKKIIQKSGTLNRYNYDVIWKKLLKNAKQCTRDNMFHGAFVSYDDTPRRGRRGIVVEKSSAEKFQKYLSELIKISSQQKKDFIFLTAWNEWGEGAFIEPDNTHSYSFAKAIKQAHDSLL